MSREIKFRAWDKIEEQMLYLDSFDIVCGKGDGRLFGWVHTEDGGYEVELMESIGLKDKNGKEIWEGDLVQLTHDAYENPPSRFIKLATKNAVCEVRWWLDGWTFSVLKSGFHYPLFNLVPKGCDANVEHLWMDGAWKNELQCEVIGNIYENPELLK